MKHGILVASLLALTLIVAPTGAFTTDNLLIAVDEDGSATITMNYTISWIERIAVFFKIAEPEQELKSALEDALGVPVTSTRHRDSTSPGRRQCSTATGLRHWSRPTSLRL